MMFRKQTFCNEKDLWPPPGTFKVRRALDVGQDQRVEVHAALVAPKRQGIVEFGLVIVRVFYKQMKIIIGHK